MKKSRKIFVTMILTLICAVGIGASALAANPTVVTLKPDRTYTSYDITGDGKPDRIRITLINYMYDEDDCMSGNEMYISVNGKKVYDPGQGFYYLNVKLYTIAHEKPLLYIEERWDDYGTPLSALFQYQNDTLKKVMDFRKIAKKCGVGQSGNIYSIKGDVITINHAILTYSSSWVEARYYYKYKNGVIKPISETAKIIRLNGRKAPRTQRTRQRMIAYKSQTSGKKLFTIPVGSRITIDRCYWNKDYMRFRIKYKGKYGWIKAATKTNRNGYSMQFKDIMVF